MSYRVTFSFNVKGKPTKKQLAALEHVLSVQLEDFEGAEDDPPPPLAVEEVHDVRVEELPPGELRTYQSRADILVTGMLAEFPGLADGEEDVSGADLVDFLNVELSRLKLLRRKR